MSMNISLAGVSTSEVQNIAGYFGYEEKRSAGSLDTTNTWTETTGGTGSVTDTAVGVQMHCGGTSGGSARLLLKAVLPSSSAILDAGRFTEFHAKFLLRVRDLASIDNNEFFVGFGSSATQKRTDNTCNGIILATDKITLLSDNGGTETTTDLSASMVAATWYNVELVLKEDYFAIYVNDVLAATHTTNVGNGTYLFTFFIQSDANVDADVHWDAFSVWAIE